MSVSLYAVPTVIPAAVRAEVYAAVKYPLVELIKIAEVAPRLPNVAAFTPREFPLSATKSGKSARSAYDDAKRTEGSDCSTMTTLVAPAGKSAVATVRASDAPDAPVISYVVAAAAAVSTAD